MSILSHQAARRAYDRIGSLQDSQAFYEDRATAVLLRHAELGSAERVFEFGCGTGRFAQRLFADYLSLTAVYRGVDLSPTMVRLAQERLAPYPPRAEVSLTDGDPPTEEPAGAYDRFVSNYVFDLLSEDDIEFNLPDRADRMRVRKLLYITERAKEQTQCKCLICENTRKGCPICNNTGYKGRIGLYEVMPMKEEIKELVLSRTSTSETKKEAIRLGMKTLRQSGILKIKDGVTTIEEVCRSTIEDR